MEGWSADAIFSSSVFLLAFLQSSFSLPSFSLLLWVPSSPLISLPPSTVFYFVHFVCVLGTKAKLGTLAFCSFLFLVCAFDPLAPGSFFPVFWLFFLWFFVPFSVPNPPLVGCDSLSFYKAKIGGNGRPPKCPVTDPLIAFNDGT